MHRRKRFDACVGWKKSTLREPKGGLFTDAIELMENVWALAELDVGCGTLRRGTRFMW